MTARLNRDVHVGEYYVSGRFNSDVAEFQAGRGLQRRKLTFRTLRRRLFRRTQRFQHPQSEIASVRILTRQRTDLLPQ